MSEISFFTPVSYVNISRKTFNQKILEGVDDYFNPMGKRVARVVVGHGSSVGTTAVIVSNKDAPTPWLLTAVKVFSYCTLLIPLILLAIKAALRNGHRFAAVDIRAALEQGIVVTPQAQEVIGRLRSQFNTISTINNHPEIRFHLNKNDMCFERQYLFSLNCAPGLLFRVEKEGRDGSENREALARMMGVKKILLAHQLHLLVQPHAKLVSVPIPGGPAQTFFVEQELSINPEESANEMAYRNHAAELNPAIDQLATYVIHAQSHNVSPMQNPVLSPDATHGHRIAFADIGRMHPSWVGYNSSMSGVGYGLMRCLFTEDQVDRVIAKTSRYGMRPCSFMQTLKSQSDQMLKERRMGEIDFYQRLQAFHASKGISSANPRQPIVLSGEDWGVLEAAFARREMRRIVRSNGTITFSPMIWREAVEDVVHHMNARIMEAPEEASLEGKRRFMLFGGFSRSSQPAEQCTRILEVLRQRGHFFSVLESLGAVIQA